MKYFGLPILLAGAEWLAFTIIGGGRAMAGAEAGRISPGWRAPNGVNIKTDDVNTSRAGTLRKNLRIAVVVVLLGTSPQASLAQTMSLPGKFGVSASGAAT